MPYNKAQGIYDINAESELQGKTRKSSNCPGAKYLPLQKYNNFNSKYNECDPQDYLDAQHTRTKRPCNVLSGVSINRFDILCEDPQANIHDNSFIGINSRNAFKDRYEELRKPNRQPGNPLPTTVQSNCCPRA